MKVKVKWKELGKQLWASSAQGADATGGDENKPTQANPVTTIVPISAME